MRGPIVHQIFRETRNFHDLSRVGQMSVGGVTLCGMQRELPPTLRYLAQRQNGVVSRSQAIRAGLSPDMVKFRISSGRWRQMHPGVYATFTGVPSRGARLWAAVLLAGPGATLSHETAAELHRLADQAADTIHVTIPGQRRVRAVEGVRLHRSARAVEAVQGNMYPPRTRVEETVLDLTQGANSFDDVCGWVTRPAEAALACGSARTYRRRGGRGPFGAGIPLSQGRGRRPWAAGAGPASALRDVDGSARAPGPRVRRVRRGGGA